MYKSFPLDCGYRLEFLVENVVVLELKAVEKLEAIHQAQLLNLFEVRWMACWVADQFQCASTYEGHQANGV
jgi:GxxExxY protein